MGAAQLLVWVVDEYHVKDHVTFGLLNAILTQPCSCHGSCVKRGGCLAVWYSLGPIIDVIVPAVADLPFAGQRFRIAAQFRTSGIGMVVPYINP